MFKKTDEELKSLSAINTVREIQSQPKLWQETFEIYKERKEEIESFIDKVKNKNDKKLRVIFTGAGTSDYVGFTIIQHLKNICKDEIIFESIATTDIVSAPYNHFKKEDKIILVSFARSGNSPESVKAVELADQIVEDIFHMPITCAKDGKLAKNLKDKENAIVLLTPEKSNDKGFAMTSSFTCMMLFALLIFDNKEEDEKETIVKTISSMGEKIISEENYIDDLVKKDFQRVIYLGSGSLGYLTKEAQLKFLELNAGKIATQYETSMAFRHGPKSFIDDKTIVISFISSNEYTKLYDMDVVNEISSDEIAEYVQIISQEKEDFKNCYNFNSDKILDDHYASFPFIIFAQIFAVKTALKIGNKPDTPSATGTVNRVVKGVIIHDYK